jgi:CDGSH-type Zn-finger protein
VTDGERRVVRVVANGPMMVEGPVSIELPDGRTVESDRFMVAICTCKRSKDYPLCDTSHRRRRRASASPPPATQGTGDGPESGQRPA